MKDITELRKEIDLLDKRLVEILEKRFKVVKAIGEYKKINHLPIFDKEREKFVLESKKELLTKEEDFEYYKRIFQLIMDISKEMEK
ncbi:chorismate mutase [Acholeplasma hippikon]|nr:chorismate mutase [Acholeplasma hippikon]